jgi:hypothetical protein
VNKKSLKSLWDLSIVYNECVNDPFFPSPAADSLNVTVVVPDAEVCLSPVVYKLTLAQQRKRAQCPARLLLPALPPPEVLGVC